MKILVTGGTGFIGKNLSVGYKLSSSDVDLRDFNKTLRFFLDYEPDVIIHCAARHGNFKEMQEDKVSFFRDNQLIDLNVFGSAVANAALNVVPDISPNPGTFNDICGATTK